MKCFALVRKGRTTARPPMQSRAASLIACVPLALAASAANAGTLTNRQIFSLPVMSRVFQENQWVLRDPDGSGFRETPASVGAALAALAPSYVSGLIRLNAGSIVSDTMISGFTTIRAAVLAQNPRARFDVEISLDPQSVGGREVFKDADALVALMKRVDAQLHLDGWWFDYYSTAETTHPEWIKKAAAYAHEHGQTIGGNVFQESIPPDSDAVAFNDGKVAGSPFGFDLNAKQVAALNAAASKTSSPSTIILGHLNNNPQEGGSTESCVFIQQWNASERFSYLEYFASQQVPVHFTFMFPVFFPECPGAYAYDPVKDRLKDGTTVYEHLTQLINQQRGRLAAVPNGNSSP